MYRNLETLEQIGLVRHVHFGHAAGLYELTRGQRHEYALCERCAKVIAVPAGELDEARAVIERVLGIEPSFTPSRSSAVAVPAAWSEPANGPRNGGSTHTPDGFLSPEVAGATAVVTVAAVGYGLKTASYALDERRVPLLGVTGAFIFAAQMLNSFPVAGGTSGHFLGAALAAILLGPWLACLTMAVVVSLQAFVFADGGVTALGANILNMGVIGALLVGGLMLASRRVLPKSRTVLLAITAVGAWLAVMAGATATSLELAISGTVPFGTVLPAMLGVHALIGIGEAVVTVGAVAAVLAARPDLIAVSDLTDAELTMPAPVLKGV